MIKIVSIQLICKGIHPVTALVQVIFTINIMKDLSCSDSIPDSKNCFLIIKIFCTPFYDGRANIKWIFTIFNFILSIALACRNRTQFRNLTLFPRVSLNLAYAHRTNKEFIK